MVIKPRQATVFLIPRGLANRMRAHVEARSESYFDVSEFAVTAIENQLALESDELRDRLEQLPRRTELPPVAPAVDHVQAPQLNDLRPIRGVKNSTPFFVLTNRLSPFPVVCRALATLMAQGQAPTSEEFIESVGALCRQVGFQLRDYDELRGLKGPARRSVAWPTRDPAEKSLLRFRSSFLLDPSTGLGPLAEAGLAASADGRVALTERGVMLAKAPNPILDGPSGDESLSGEQRDLLVETLLDMEVERVEVAAFYQAASAAYDAYSIDSALSLRHPSWSENRISAHRSAMVGRLRDAGLVSTRGSGRKAIIELSADLELFDEWRPESTT